MCTASVRKWERSLNLSPGCYEAFLVWSLPSAAKMRSNPIEQTAKHLRIWYHQSKFSAREKCSSARLPKHQPFIIALLGEAISEILTAHMILSMPMDLYWARRIYSRSYISDPIGPLTALSHPWAIETHGARKASNPRFFCILVQGCSNEAPQLLQSIKHIWALTSCMQRVYVIGLWNPCPCFILLWWRSHQNIPAHLPSA